MQKLVVNDASQLELLKAHDRVEVCDDEGNPIGFFVSCHEQDAELYAWAKTQLSEEELQQRKDERENGRTTAEVIKRLAAQ